MASKWDGLTEVQRFWTHVNVGLAHECWNWTGCKNKFGYGSWRSLIPVTRQMNAHRYAYIMAKGLENLSLHIDHLCRNRACVNPAHLEAVSPKTNILRGQGFAAKNSRKTHCIAGHKFTKGNTYIRKEGFRQCKTCRNRRSLAFKSTRPGTDQSGFIFQQ